MESETKLAMATQWSERSGGVSTGCERNTGDLDGGRVSSRLKESLLGHLNLKLYLAITTELRFDKVMSPYS